MVSLLWLAGKITFYAVLNVEIKSLTGLMESHVLIAEKKQEIPMPLDALNVNMPMFGEDMSGYLSQDFSGRSIKPQHVGYGKTQVISLAMGGSILGMGLSYLIDFLIK